MEAAYVGYPKGFWWRVLISSCKKLGSGVVTAIVPVNVSGTVHDCKFVLTDGNRTYGIVVCDNGNAGAAWLEGANKSVKQLESKYGVQRAALVVRNMKGLSPPFLPGTGIPIIIGANPGGTAAKLVTAIRG